jgi:hypothetical protein
MSCQIDFGAWPYSITEGIRMNDYIYYAVQVRTLPKITIIPVMYDNNSVLLENFIICKLHITYDSYFLLYLTRNSSKLGGGKRFSG